MNTFNYFYHETIKRYIGSFIYLFSDIYIYTNEKYIKVPVLFNSTEVRMHRKVVNGDSSDAYSTGSNKVINSVPRMSVELVDMVRRPLEQTNPLNRITQKHKNIDLKTKNSMKNSVPYTFTFTLNIKTKTYTDLLQIVEQIAPHFSPSVSLSVEVVDQSSFPLTKDIEIVLDDIDINSSHEDGDRETNGSLTFTLYGDLFNKVNADTRIITGTKLIFSLDDGTFMQSIVPSRNDAEVDVLNFSTNLNNVIDNVIGIFSKQE